MNSMFKNALMVTLLVSAGSAVCIPENYESPLSIKKDLEIIGNALKGYCAQAIEYARTASTKSFDYAHANTPEWVAQTCAYLAEMPKPADDASLGGYGTTENAKNVLAKVGAAAVVAAAGYVVYKIAFKKTKKYV